MTSYFGILPSATLSQDIQLAQANRNSKEPQYPLRDKISLQLTDELIDTMLVHLVQQFPPSDKLGGNCCTKCTNIVSISSSVS